MSRDGKASSSARVRLRRLLRAVAIGLLGVVLMECAARVLLSFAGPPPTESPDNFATLGLRSSAELGWERHPNFVGFFAREPGRYRRRLDHQGFLLVDGTDYAGSRTILARGDSDGAGHRTILALGDSSTFGWGAPPEFSFTHLLARRVPGARVINLGVLGHSSFQGYKALLRYAPVLKPDLIIVSYNYNDRRYVLRPEDQDTDAKFEREHAARRIIGTAEHLHLFRVLRGALRISGMVTPPPYGPGANLDVRTLHARVPPEKYRENLRSFAEFGRQTGTPLVFLVMGDNPAYTDYLRQGVDLFHKSQYDAAVRKLEIATYLENIFSEVARKYLVLAWERLGAAEEADQAAHLHTPFFFTTGARPLHLDVEYSDIMRSVAKEYGIEVVDAARVLEKDPSLYVDYCHPNRRGYEVIANLLDRPVRRLLQGNQADRVSDPPS